MTAGGQGLTAPSRQHTPSPTAYRSGWCGSTRHDRCLGAYAGTACDCTCHTTPEPQPMQPFAVHCSYGCSYEEGGTDPLAVHDAMERHYRTVHESTAARHCPTCTCGGDQ